MPDDVFQQVLDAARAQGVTEIEAIVTTDSHALTRFANNEIHQNVAERSTHLSIRPVIDGRTARASTNRLAPERVAGPPAPPPTARTRTPPAPPPRTPPHSRPSPSRTRSCCRSPHPLRL